MAHQKVSIIINNTNTCGALKLCLENLIDIYPNMEVIVSDTNSYDGSPETVEKEFPWVKLIKNPNNGLAYGLNTALKIATGDYYLYLGSDGFPEKDTAEGLVRYFEEHPDVGAATVKLVLKSGEQDMDGHRGFPTPWVSLTHFLHLDKLFPKSKLFAGYFMTYEDLNKEHEIDACITHFLFVSKKAQDKVGKWDAETFFLYGEDIDMCKRIKEAGFKIMYLPQFKAQHWKGLSIGIRKTSQEDFTKIPLISFRGNDITRGQLKVMMQRHSTEAMGSFYKKHYQKDYPFYITWLVIATIRLLKICRIQKQKYLNKKQGLK
jgi:hypothetical protein